MKLVDRLAHIFGAMLVGPSAGSPSSQRGILDLGFSKKKEKSVSQQQTEATRDSTKRTESEKTADTQEQQTQEQQRTLFSLEVQQQLEQQLLTFLGTGGNETVAGASAAELASLGDFLRERASGAEAAIGEQTGALLANARREGQRELGRLQTGLARAAGSGQNSVVQLATQEAANDLQVQLAGLEAQLNLNARNTATSEFDQVIKTLSAAPAAAAQGTNELVQLASVLRGATETVTGTTERQATAQESLTANETLNEIIKSLTTGASSSKRSGFSLGLGFK